MSFAILVQVYDRLPESMRTIFLIVLLFLGYKGFLKLPFIKTKKIDTYKKIWDIKTRVTLYEQMNVFEVAHRKITILMKKVYLNLTDDEHANQDYEMIVNEAETECKAFIRKWMKENHLTSKTNQEFTMYKQSNIEDLLGIVVYYLDRKYKDSFFKIPRKELSENNFRDVVPFARETWNKAFDDCRDISFSNEKKIKELEGNKC